MKQHIYHYIRKVINQPLIFWMILGFFTSYILFFILPIFLNSKHSIQFFQYIPSINPIGEDLRQMLSYSKQWLIYNNTPYIGANLYPPLASLLFIPLIFLEFTNAYSIITFISIVCYLILAFLFPLWVSERRIISSVIVLFFITGLFSYGFQFELERGQFNVISFLLCFISIWIIHAKHKYHYLAYILFTISIQLKIFPVIFIVMLIRDWGDWKNNIKRLSGLLAINIILFFVLGPRVFIDFFEAIKLQTLAPAVWIGNHSIHSFTSLVSTKGIEKLDLTSLAWLSEFSGLMQFALFTIVIVCIFLIILHAYRSGQKNINLYLLLACTIGALLIPSVSHDYKLSLLASPITMLFIKLNFTNITNIRLKLVLSLLISLFCFAYSSTLFSYTNKPIVLGNNFPALMVMLITTTILSFTNKIDNRIQTVQNEKS